MEIRADNPFNSATLGTPPIQFGDELCKTPITHECKNQLSANDCVFYPRPHPREICLLATEFGCKSYVCSTFTSLLIDISLHRGNWDPDRTLTSEPKRSIGLIKISLHDISSRSMASQLATRSRTHQHHAFYIPNMQKQSITELIEFLAENRFSWAIRSITFRLLIRSQSRSNTGSVIVDGMETPPLSALDEDRRRRKL